MPHAERTATFVALSVAVPLLIAGCAVEVPAPSADMSSEPAASREVAVATPVAFTEGLFDRSNRTLCDRLCEVEEKKNHFNFLLFLTIESTKNLVPQ